MGISVKHNHSKKADKIYESREIDWDAWEKEWDRRKNTEFGKLLTELNDIVFDWLGEYDDHGFKSTPISEIMLEYFDGENDLIGLVNHIKRVLENYDMMQDDDVRKIINRLNRIARSNKDRNLLESLVEKYGAKEVKSAINRLNEDSLDDFDIDGRIERKRNAVPDDIKLKVKNLLNKNYQKLYKYCDEFFEMNDLNIQISKRDYNTNNNTYVIYYPDLLWGFAYNENDPVEFVISVGLYGSIAGNRDHNENKQLLIELGDFLKSHIKGLEYRDNDIRKTEMSEIYRSSYVLPVSIKLKDLR